MCGSVFSFRLTISLPGPDGSIGQWYRQLRKIRNLGRLVSESGSVPFLVWSVPSENWGRPYWFQGALPGKPELVLLRPQQEAPGSNVGTYHSPGIGFVFASAQEVYQERTAQEGPCLFLDRFAAFYFLLTGALQTSWCRPGKWFNRVQPPSKTVSRH